MCDLSDTVQPEATGLTTPNRGDFQRDFTFVGSHEGFVNWSGGQPASSTFTMPSSSAVTTLSAFFWKYYKLSLSTVGHGSVTTVLSSADGTFASGTVVSVHATPEGVFGTFSGDLSGKTNPQAITMSGPKACRNRRLILVFLILFQPSHLNRFQLPFSRPHGIIREPIQLRDPLMQIRIPYMRRVHLRKLLGQRERNVVDLIPREFGHGYSILVPFSLPATVKIL